MIDVSVACTPIFRRRGKRRIPYAPLGVVALASIVLANVVLAVGAAAQPAALSEPLLSKLTAAMPAGVRIHVVDRRPLDHEGRVSTTPTLLPAGLLATAPMILVARVDLTSKDGGEAVDDVRRRAGSLRIAEDGTGQSSSRCSQSLQAHMGVTIAAAVLRAGETAGEAVATGSADIACIDATVAMPLLKSGRVVGLAVAGEDRLSSAWDVPAAAEVGLPLFTQTHWIGLYVDPDSSPATRVRANTALQTFLADETTVQALGDAGLTPFPMTHRGIDAHAAFLAAQAD